MNRPIHRLDAEAKEPPEADAVGGMPWGQSSHVIQQLWFSVIRHDWRSLAVVPVAPGRAGLEVANALSEVGGIHRRSPLIVFDGLSLELRQVANLLDELAKENEANERSLIALDSPLSNLSGVPVARAADKILLVVELGRASFAGARKLMEMVGPEKVLGSVVFEGGRP
ncbi:MAG TPA: hypothetical protein VGK67_25440 [Myxococcales bacterium]|jgi:hypothetical protein